MERNDEYRSLRQELLKMDRDGFQERSDVEELQKMLKRLCEVTTDTEILNTVRRFYNLMPVLKCMYMNLDDGDVAYLEKDWNYKAIKHNLHLLVEQMYHGLRVV